LKTTLSLKKAEIKDYILYDSINTITPKQVNPKTDGRLVGDKREGDWIANKPGTSFGDDKNVS
jgi:hypothetical protein